MTEKFNGGDHDHNMCEYCTYGRHTCECEVDYCVWQSNLHLLDLTLLSCVFYWPITIEAKRIVRSAACPRRSHLKVTTVRESERKHTHTHAHLLARQSVASAQLSHRSKCEAKRLADTAYSVVVRSFQACRAFPLFSSPSPATRNVKRVQKSATVNVNALR